MIVEGRTITNVAEMLEFCLAAVAQTYVEPAAICLHVAQEMRVAEITLKDGSRTFDVPSGNTALYSKSLPRKCMCGMKLKRLAGSLKVNWDFTS